MASGEATGWDSTGEGGTKGLLTFLSLGISSFGLSSRTKGSGKKRGSGDFIARHTSARGSSTSYKKTKKGNINSHWTHKNMFLFFFFAFNKARNKETIQVSEYEKIHVGIPSEDFEHHLGFLNRCGAFFCPIVNCAW